MNTKIITALVVGIALVALTGAASAINPYVEGGAHYGYGDSTLLTLEEGVYVGTGNIESTLNFDVDVPGCTWPSAIVGQIKNRIGDPVGGLGIGAKGAVDGETTPVVWTQSGSMDVMLNAPVFNDAGQYLGDHEFVWDGEATNSASIGANTPDHGASQRHTYEFRSDAFATGNCQPSAPITATDAGVLDIGMGSPDPCGPCDPDAKIDSSRASVTFDFGANVDTDTPLTSMIKSSIKLDTEVVGSLIDPETEGTLRIDVWQLWEEINLNVGGCPGC